MASRWADPSRTCKAFCREGSPTSMLQARRAEHVNHRSHTAAGQPPAAQSATLGGLPRERGVSHRLDAEIWARCEQLRTAKIPFLVVSPRQSAAIQQASLSHGAKGVMVKPLVVKELIGVIQSILEE